MQTPCKAGFLAYLKRKAANVHLRNGFQLACTERKETGVKAKPCFLQDEDGEGYGRPSENLGLCGKRSMCSAFLWILRYSGPPVIVQIQLFMTIF
jgi:hypothetical protein